MFKEICDTKSHVQEYECCIMTQMEFNDSLSKRAKPICVDKCLYKELRELWDLGITTTGCCCGHHVNSWEGSSFIGVEFTDIPKMKALGYQVRKNTLRPDDEDSFIPKTQIIKPLTNN